MIEPELWAELEASYPDETGLVRRRVLEDRPYDMFVAVAQPARKRLLVLRTSADGLTLPHLPATAALSNHIAELPSEHVEIRVVLEEPLMSNVFSPFVDDVILAVGATATEQQAVDALADRFEHWRNLLSGGPDGMRSMAVRGLFGELWVLKHLLTPVLGTCNSVIAWTGPDRERRDFSIGSSAIEVKTTISRPPAAVTVTSELQLDTSGLDGLLLIALELDPAVGRNGHSLPDLVDEISVQTGECGADFGSRLNRWGYLDAHRPHYEDTRFVIRHLYVYGVTDGFPRITPSDIHSGLGEVSYRLSLGACEPWQYSQAAVDDWFVAATAGGPAE